MNCQYRIIPFIVFILLVFSLLSCAFPKIEKPISRAPVVKKTESPVDMLQGKHFPIANDLHLTTIPQAVEKFFADDMETNSLKAAIGNSIKFYQKSKKRKTQIGENVYTNAEMITSLQQILGIIVSKLTADEKKARIEREFDIYTSAGVDGKGTMVFTAYYEPILNGSLKKDGVYQYPIYAPPPELASKKTNTNRPTRKEIDIDGVLADRDLEILWVNDPVALFFLHIQGSGKIRLPDGEILQLTFANTNGKKFWSIAEYMYQKKLINNRAQSTVIRYLYEHPREILELLSYNERYTFFRIAKGQALGALGFPVTAGRTIAVDFSIFPRGSVGIIKTALPQLNAAGTYSGTKNISRFVLCQDAGTAIKGAGRIDLFCGDSPDAETIANSMKGKGYLFIIVKKK